MNLTNAKRDIGRRVEDFTVREKNERFQKLCIVGQTITAEMDIKILFPLVMDQTNNIMNTQRSTVFLYDEKSDELWSLVATGIEKYEIRIPANTGIAGWVFRNKEPLIVNEAYKDPRFNVTVDSKTGFKTENILCVPLVNNSDRCIGVLQSLNKNNGNFSDEDSTFLSAISDYAVIALENSILYETVKNSDQAKAKAISHLSHELKTPLSIIRTSFELIQRLIKENNSNNISKPVTRGMKNIQRLVDLQYKLEDIIDQKTDVASQRYSTLLENIKYFIEEWVDNGSGDHQNLIENIVKRIDTTLQLKEIFYEEVSLDDFFKKLNADISSYCVEREITLTTNIEKKLVISMDKGVLNTICTGLLKNAIENTPDKGHIDISAKAKNDHIQIEVKDYGIGITKKNQRNIFSGFFHTQDTMKYSSKKPYEFNAGGSGADLLRMKVLSERLNFSIVCESTRCPFISKDEDVCPGKIPLCKHIDQIASCYSSGGSLFTLKFPKTKGIANNNKNFQPH